MKKRIVSLILAVLVVAGLMATAVFAAGDAPAETPVTITVDGVEVSVYHRDRVEPTCTKNGTIEYWKAVAAPTCYGKRTNEETKQEEYYELKDWNKEVVLKALGHDKEHHEAVASTCKVQGTIEYWHCKRCEKNFSDEACTKEVTDLKAPLAAHTLTKTEPKAATCTEAGNNAYWTCSVCEKVFSDAEGKNETTVAEQTIPALNHDYTGAKITYTWTGVTACKAESTQPLPVLSPRLQPARKLAFVLTPPLSPALRLSIRPRRKPLQQPAITGSRSGLGPTLTSITTVLLL